MQGSLLQYNFFGTEFKDCHELTWMQKRVEKGTTTTELFNPFVLIDLRRNEEMLSESLNKLQ